MPFAPWLAASPHFDADAWENAVRAHDAWMARLTDLSPAWVLGARPVTRDGQRLNEGFVWHRDTGVRAVHQKCFLPDEEGYWEAKWYQPGAPTFDVVAVGAAAVAMLICTEIWSLGHAQRYGKAGADILATPRATGRPTVEKWLVGGRAAAIVSGAFSISSNWTARDDGGDFGGGGWIIDPDGAVLARTTRDAPLATIEVDLDAARAAKSTYPRYALE